ncbi:hypothetical protein T484DRAFT_1787170 [Baffinella frigidus]|nr:hypothetical protein T484DRAFT_1787170 [Cryptophyta sp. CCMP2293]
MVRQVEPIELICTINRIFSQFDQPGVLIRTINRIFSQVDPSLQSRGLFKVDTIGDAYVAAG